MSAGRVGKCVAPADVHSEPTALHEVEECCGEAASSSRAAVYVTSDGRVK